MLQDVSVPKTLSTPLKSMVKLFCGKVVHEEVISQSLLLINIAHKLDIPPALLLE